MLKQKEQIQQVWDKPFYKQILQKFIPQPTKHQKSGYQPKEGDICLFKQEESGIGNPHRKIRSISHAEESRYKKTRQITIEYRNSRKPQEVPETLRLMYYRHAIAQ